MGFKDKLIAGFIVRWLKKQEGFMKFLEGRKTYLVQLTQIIMGGLIAYNQHCATPESGCAGVAIPGAVIIILGTLGLWTRKVAKP